MKSHPEYSHILVNAEGEIFSKLSGKIKKLKTHVTPHGYECCCIPVGQGKSISKRVHRLIAETYLPNPENLREVDHIDCNKLNNNLGNLEWVSSKENKRRAKENGLYDKNIGENHYKSILTEDVVHKICQCLQDGMRNKEVSEMFNLDKGFIAHIKRGDIWNNIVTQYTFSFRRVKRKHSDFIHKVCEFIKEGRPDQEITRLFDGEISRYDVKRIRDKVIHKIISDLYF